MLSEDNGLLCFFPGGTSPSGRAPFRGDLRTGKGRRMAGTERLFCARFRSLTTIHLNRVSNIAGARVRCTIHRWNKEALLQGNLYNIQASFHLLDLHFYPLQVSAFNGIIRNIRRNVKKRAKSLSLRRKYKKELVKTLCFFYNLLYFFFLLLLVINVTYDCAT